MLGGNQIADFVDWDARTSSDLQQLVDEVCCGEVLDLEFSVTIADATRDDCPLVACSRGFTELTGYSVKEIVGRNCRFLLDNVPEHLIDQESRIKCRTYIETSRNGKALEEATSNKQLQPEAMRMPWMKLTSGEILCVQTNAKKSGELFKNMFYMKQVQLNGQSFVLGLQAGLPEEWENCMGAELEAFCQEAFVHLGKNMSQFEAVLSRHFWYSSAMRRQGGMRTLLPGLLGGIMATSGGPQALRSLVAPGGESASSGSISRPVESFTPSITPVETGFNRQQSQPLHFDKDWAKQTSATSEASTVATESFIDALEWEAGRNRAPEELHTAFHPGGVKLWCPSQYEVLHKLQDATRNQGTVCLMRDLSSGRLVATKVMPNCWVKESHGAFVAAHPTESEQPWQDVGCNQYLDEVGYPFSIGLLGVYRDEKNTHVVSRFAAGGDLFGWASNLEHEPGPQREAVLKPLVRQLFRSVQQLHELQISHRDISAENVLVTTGATPSVKVIDFGAASTLRYLQGVAGKPSYQAPEIFEGCDFDSFLTDAFALGVTIYAICVMDYPWMDTKSRGDKCVQFIRMKGFKAFVARRRLPNSTTKVVDVVSPELLDILEGLLDFDVTRRFCLGESAFQGTGRPSVWNSPWMK
mmetsp:Transcript_2366/g.5009  ORF Transcript_2366/g.5009 Transcript_2366/m.5009 type:complete len:640 (-) Transcript_2366:53-1972(-)